MADISKITLPDNSQYNLKDARVPADAKFTDTNNAVTQTITNDNKNYRVLLSGTDDNTTRTEGARKDGDFYYNPSSNTLHSGSFDGVIREHDINWGTKKFTGSFALGDAFLNDYLRANRFSGLKAEGITVEYSTDAGNTWITYDTTDLNKQNLFTVDGYFWVGGSSTGTVTADNQLRVTIDTMKARVYTRLNKIQIYISTNYSQNCKVTIKAALGSDPNNYTLTICENQPISGWPAWNIIPCDFTAYGNSSASASQYGQIQFTFTQEGLSNTSKKGGLCVQRIFGFGGVGWVTPSNMALSGHAYTFDGDMNVSFPKNVHAASFNGHTIASSVPADAKFTDTTYESKTAASGGTDVSLVTTGEKYTWNNKSSLTLGTTSSTAYRGDYGNTAYTHATDSSRLTTAKSSGLYKVAVTNQGHVASVTEVAKSDITGLGIPAQDTTYTFDAVDGQLRVTPSSGSSYLVPLGDGNASVVYYELDFNGSSTIEQSGEVASIADQIIQDFEDGNRKIIVGARNTIIDDLIDESETSATNVLYFDITSVSGTESITITGSVFDGVHYINNEAINKYTLIISNTAETGITWVAMMQRNNMIVETDKAGLMDWDSYSQLMNETSRDYSYTPTYNTSNSNKVWKTDANGSPAWRKNDGVSWTLDFNGSDTATVPASMISEIRTAYSGGSVIIVRAINVTLGTVANNSRIEFHMTTIGMTGTFALVGYYVGEPPIAGVSKIMNFILTITPNTVSNLDGTAVIESDNLEVSNTRRGLMAPTVFRQIWNRASSSDDSDASKNTDNANKVWKCDASGNPGWRTDADTTYSTVDYNSSGLSSADMYRRVYNVDSTDGSVVSSRNWYVYMTGSDGSPGWRDNAATYNHPGLFGSSQYRQIFNRVSATDDSYNTDNANKVWKCNASGTPAWRDDDNTTYSDFTAATSSAAGTHGLVPAPAAGKQASYLRGDKTWQAAANNLTTTAGGLLLDARQGKALNDKITAIEGNDHYTNSVMTNVTNATIIKFGRDTGAITNSIWNFDASGTFSSIYWAIVYVDNTSSTWVCTATAIVSSTTVRARLHQRNAMNTNQTVDAGPHVSVVVCGVAK